MIGNEGLNTRPINTAAPAAGPIADDILEGASASIEVVSQTRTTNDDLLVDTSASIELIAARKDATQDELNDATADALALTTRKDATQDELNDATSDVLVLSALATFYADVLNTGSGDETILTEVQTSVGIVSDDLTEDATADETVLAQHPIFRQDVAEDATAEKLLIADYFHAFADVLENENASPQLILEVMEYRQDVLEDVTADVLYSTLANKSSDDIEDALSDSTILTETPAYKQDVLEDATAAGDQPAADDILETATARGNVISDPVREDIYEWIWPRARIANTYTTDTAADVTASDVVTTKLILDIAVDITAFAELAGESFAYSADITDSVDADEVVDATIAALASIEEAAYIGAAVTKGAGSFYNELVEDADGSEELTQRLITSADLAVDATGRDDVAGTVWFKAHSFIEDATASDAVLTDVVTRPTKDDLLAGATGDVEVLTATMHAVSAWSEDVLAEAELLGNESGEAWVLNSRTLAFSRYVGFDASQVTTVDEKPLAAGARGVMSYSASRAEGFVKTGLSDYGAPQLKRIRHAYVTAASRQPLALSTLHGIGDVLKRTTYQIDTLDSTVPYTHRLNLARGDQGQFWAFELRAPAGPPTTLLNLRVIPLVTTRRI